MGIFMVVISPGGLGANHDHGCIIEGGGEMFRWGPPLTILVCERTR